MCRQWRLETLRSFASRRAGPGRVAAQPAGAPREPAHRPARRRRGGDAAAARRAHRRHGAADGPCRLGGRAPGRAARRHPVRRRRAGAAARRRPPHPPRAGRRGGGAGSRAARSWSPARPTFLARRVADFLRAEARRRLSALVAAKAAGGRVRPRRVTVKDTRSRWGSCAANRNLAFSWRLVMAPRFVQDYVAAHEVAHLRHMNHGTALLGAGART